ncbi:MAG: hypothetical protein K0R03_2620 [Moraxellaceae bacterium]|jgi:hypothetical protein|nr:hypothetical protein [Moraxellaceae bacterium]
MSAATFFDMVAAGGTTTADALALFDRLEPVATGFMLGAWKGAGFPTHHPLDGVLEAYHWYGKRFENPEDVHPLVFATTGGELVSVNPLVFLPALGLLRSGALPKSAAAGKSFQLGLPLMATRRSCARLRMTEYRGKASATMIYDALPINDVFRQVDADTVLGVMDLKGMAQPFFFVLRRE